MCQFGTKSQRSNVVSHVNAVWLTISWMSWHMEISWKRRNAFLSYKFHFNCIANWKLPGTLLIWKTLSNIQPFLSLKGVFWVFSINPTSWRPSSSWMSIPTTENLQFYFVWNVIHNNEKENIHSQDNLGRVILIWTGIFSSKFPGLSTNSSDTLKNQ